MKVLHSLSLHLFKMKNKFPAHEERKKSNDSSDLTVCNMGADYLMKSLRKKKRYLGNENHRWLYWHDPMMNSCPKEKSPGSPRTFSTAPYPRTHNLRADAITTLVPFFFPFSLFHQLYSISLR